MSTHFLDVQIPTDRWTTLAEDSDVVTALHRTSRGVSGKPFETVTTTVGVTVLRFPLPVFRGGNPERSLRANISANLANHPLTFIGGYNVQ
jgi:hypothetical protein